MNTKSFSSAMKGYALRIIIVLLILVSGLSGCITDGDVITTPGLPRDTSGITDGQILEYNSSSGLFEPGDDDSGAGGGTGNIENGTATGQMAFWNNISGEWNYTDTDELFWDDTNKRLGVGTSSPNNALEVYDGNIRISTTPLASGGIGNAQLHFYYDGTHKGFLNAGTTKFDFRTLDKNDFRVSTEDTGGTLQYDRFIVKGNRDYPQVAIGTQTPASGAALDVRGGDFIFNDDSNDHDFRIESDSNQYMFIVDAGNDRVGIADNTPGVELEVEGSITYSGTLTDDSDSRIKEVIGSIPKDNIISLYENLSFVRYYLYEYWEDENGSYVRGNLTDNMEIGLVAQTTYNLLVDQGYNETVINSLIRVGNATQVWGISYVGFSVLNGRMSQINHFRIKNIENWAIQLPGDYAYDPEVDYS